MNVAQVFTTAIGVIALFGGAAAYFGKSRGDSIIQYQADELEINKTTIARLQAENLALHTQVETLQAQIVTLTSIAQGSPQIANLKKEIRRLVKEVADGKR